LRESFELDESRETKTELVDEKGRIKELQKEIADQAEKILKLEGELDESRETKTELVDEKERIVALESDIGKLEKTIEERDEKILELNARDVGSEELETGLKKQEHELESLMNKVTILENESLLQKVMIDTLKAGDETYIRLRTTLEKGSKAFKLLKAENARLKTLSKWEPDEEAEAGLVAKLNTLLGEEQKALEDLEGEMDTLLQEKEDQGEQLKSIVEEKWRVLELEAMVIQGRNKINKLEKDNRMLTLKKDKLVKKLSGISKKSS